MALKIVVLAKQVPDTRNVGKDAMTAEGTVNRAALPAIFNPEDLNALEQALRLKEQNPGSTVGILTMGPPRAGEIIRQGLYRGADTGWLLTDRCRHAGNVLRAGHRHQEDWRCRYRYRRSPGYRRRYGAGWSSGGSEAGTQPGDLC